MLLSDIVNVEYSADRTARLYVPSIFLSMINVQLKSQPELFVYTCKQIFKDTGMPEFKQVIFSPIKLSRMCTFLRINTVNTPGTFKNIAKFLKDNKINILKTDDSTIGARGIVEIYLDFSKSALKADDLAHMLEDQISGNIVLDYSEPETIQEICGNDFHKKIIQSVKIQSSDSTHVQIPLERKILDSVGVNWLPSLEHSPVKARAIISTYLRFPMLVSTLLEPGQQIIRLRASLRDVPGSLCEVLTAVEPFLTIYASDTIEYKDAYTSWDAIAFLLRGAKPDGVEKALREIGENWIDKETISIKIET